MHEIIYYKKNKVNNENLETIITPAWFPEYSTDKTSLHPC